MTFSDWIRFVSLAAIWGSSFAFMRIAAPALGATPTACFRILISGTFLVIFFILTQKKIYFKTNFKHYWIMGMLNGALPFLFFSFAALHIPAGLSVILNATAPLFTALLSLFFLNERFTLPRLMGLLFGLMGVTLIAYKGSFETDSLSHIAILAGLGSAFCYASGGIYIKKIKVGIDPSLMTGASQFLGGLTLLPFCFFHWAEHPLSIEQFTPNVILALFVLSFICSSLAFIVFYRLVARVGPTRALTVGYLMPVFGMLIGAYFLNEIITKNMLIGCVLILCGVYVANKKYKKTIPASN